MKKMVFGIVFVIVVALLVFAGCVSFTKGEIDVHTATDEPALDEYETMIASAMDVPVTGANGEPETNEAGEVLTSSVLVEEMNVPVTNANGETVTDANGEQQTTKIYVDTNSGRVITDSIGEVKTTQVYKDKKTGEIVATTKADNDSKGGTQTTTLAPNELNTTQPAQPANTTANEFDYLKSGNFYIQGTMTDSSGQSLPLEMAVTANSVYMLSNFEGAAMGMLINNGTTYMIYPAEKSYLELNSTVLKAMGMDTNDLISSADLDYSQYDLAKADDTLTETLNGAECTVYVYNNSSGSTRFFMNGNKLVRFATYDANGNPDTVNDVGYITNQVPADKINPPADYKEYKGITGMFSFISLLGDVVGE